MSSTATKIEPIYVADTNALIWHLTGDRRLGKTAKEIFKAAENGETQIVLSAISMAELYYGNSKNKWFPDFAKVYQELTSAPHFQFRAFTIAHVKDFDVNAAVPEMHDRIITGLARQLNVPLIASDPQIVKAKLVTIVCSATMNLKGSTIV